MLYIAPIGERDDSEYNLVFVQSCRNFRNKKDRIKLSLYFSACKSGRLSCAIFHEEGKFDRDFTASNVYVIWNVIHVYVQQISRSHLFPLMKEKTVYITWNKKIKKKPFKD